jgi:nucleoside-diphosphate-sugar epimerase
MIIEKVCKQHNIKFIILRFGTVYGGRANKFNTVAKYINAAKTKKKYIEKQKEMK